MRLPINPDHEMKVLLANFVASSAQMFTFSKPTFGEATFRQTNWIVAFPLNFCLIRDNANVQLMRQMGVANLNYLLYFFREDPVLDDYHLPKEEFRAHVLAFCEAHTIRNMAVGQMVHISGPGLLQNLLDYEKKFYDAQLFEKRRTEVSSSTMFNREFLAHLGHKIFPLCLPLACFCRAQGFPELIPEGESLVRSYHTAHQLFDDFKDREDDLLKPDLSYLLKACQTDLGVERLELKHLHEWLTADNYRMKRTLFATIQAYLDEAEAYAKSLNFEFFLAHLTRMRQVTNDHNRN